MALSFPLSIAGFQDTLRLKSVVFYLPPNNQATSGQGSGVTLSKDLAPSLWMASCQTTPLNMDASVDAQALLEQLDGGINTFLLYDAKRPFPKSGTFSDTNVKINSVGSDGFSLSLKGLPAGKVITRGDMLSYQYGSNSSYALHKCQETVTANGSGVTPEFRVTYAPRPGIAVDQVVKMIKPVGEFYLLGSFAPSNDDALHFSYSFTAQQRIRN